MNIAIITGASSGLGKVFFEKIVERYENLDEIWLIARREDRLKELAGKYQDRKKVRVLPLDLSDVKSIEKFDEILKEQKPNIKVVINNAGVDRAGLFREMSQKDIYSLLFKCGLKYERRIAIKEMWVEYMVVFVLIFFLITELAKKLTMHIITPGVDKPVFMILAMQSDPNC